MKELFSPSLLPSPAVFITCSSHEVRCRGILSRLEGWKPTGTALFHYTDENKRREENHREMESELRSVSAEPTVLLFTETDAAKSLRSNMQQLREILFSAPDLFVVLDISVLTRRHLLMLLRWLDDEGFWDRLTVVYSEPEDYDVSQYLPLSFGLGSFRQVPGFPACPNLSRPIHLVLFLGYEGDRALAVYEHVEPMRATLVIPYPPSKPFWVGRTETFNADLLDLVGGKARLVDPVDPDAAETTLSELFDSSDERGEYAKILCPLGTKPQTLGIYSYIRDRTDAPAVVYASPLRHNHEFYSHGIGGSWVLKQSRRS
jgi:hypothetical protein